MLHSLARNHAPVDRNKRLSRTACRTLLVINGQWIAPSENDRFDFVIQVATGAVSDVNAIAARLGTWSFQDG